MSTYWRSTALACAFFLSSCYTMEGPPQIINAGGVVNHVGAAPTKRTENLKNNFAFAVSKASDTGTTNSAAISEMVDSGVLLVRSNCSDFFRLMASTQRGSQISRDMVAPILTALTSFVALRNFGAEKTSDYVTALGIGSSAALVGLDIVDKHFLFGSENIHEVQQLTFKALVAHQGGILKKQDLNFERAMEQLIDHQIICTPASILDLTRKAIAAGDVRATSRSTAPSNSDEQVLAALGDELGLPGALTPDQAGALWWLLWGGGTPTQVAPKLANLGTASPVQPDSAGVLALTTTSTVIRPALRNHLARLSPETRNSFRATIAALDGGQTANFSIARTESETDKIVLEVD